MILRQKYSGPEALLQFLEMNINITNYVDNPYYKKLRLLMGNRLRNLENAQRVLNEHGLKSSAYFSDGVLFVDLEGPRNKQMEDEIAMAMRRIPKVDSYIKGLLETTPKNALKFIYRMAGKPVPSKFDYKIPIKAEVEILEDQPEQKDVMNNEGAAKEGDSQEVDSKGTEADGSARQAGPDQPDSGREEESPPTGGGAEAEPNPDRSNAGTDPGRESFL